jgi:exodeoxyribonuclease VII large subunit
MLALPAQRLDAVAQRLGGGLQANITKQAARLAQSAARLTPAALKARLQFAGERLNALMMRAGRQMQTALTRQNAGLEALSRQLRLLSHESVLERGFALVLDETGKPLRAAEQAETGSLLDIRLAHEGRVAARVEAGGAASPKKPTKKPKAKAKTKPSGDGGQGQLI